MPIAIRRKMQPIDIVDACDAAREGRSIDDIADELDITPSALSRYIAHVPNGSPRDLARASILARADAGDWLDAIASLEACTIPFVARILRARELERGARATLEATKDAPCVQERPKHRFTFDEVFAMRAKLSALEPSTNVRALTPAALRRRLQKAESARDEQERQAKRAVERERRVKRSPEERIEQRRESQRRRRANLSPDERCDRNRRRREWWANLSPDERRDRNRRYNAAWKERRRASAATPAHSEQSSPLEHPQQHLP